ncbi:MAG: ABC transporter permease [Deltaproteobacteria bacterium]|nr:ABC transporter permease [Deltaproteobacteria bacterium]
MTDAGPKTATIAGDAGGGAVRRTGRALLDACDVVGGMTLLQWRILRAMIPPTFDYDESLRQLYKVGVLSVGVVVATALFTGAIMVVQTGGYVRSTGTTSLVGWATATAVLTEVGPVLIGLMFSGRVGANNTAELGTMKVTDQLDALRLLGIDPIRYLIVPRFLAMLIMLVLLTCIGDVFALLGGATAGRVVLGIDFRVYWQSVIESHLLDEFLMGLLKGFVFGGAISIVSCYWGLRVEGGAVGVGRAVNNSVVTAAIAIFVTNFVVSVLWS